MKGWDSIAWYIATSHSLLGHDVTARMIGMPSGDKSACVICQYERQPNDLTRQAVYRALAKETS